VTGLLDERERLVPKPQWRSIQSTPMVAKATGNMIVGKIAYSELLPIRPVDAAKGILETYSQDRVKALITLLQIGIGE
jgi:hypothetical protein